MDKHERLDQCLAAISRYNPQIRAVITVMETQARHALNSALSGPLTGRIVASLFRKVDILAMPTVGFGAPLASDAPDMMAMTHRLTRLTSLWAFALLLAAGIAFQDVTGHHLLIPPLLGGAPQGS